MSFKLKIFIAIIFCYFCCINLQAQNDSVTINRAGNIVSAKSIEKIKDTIPKYRPRKAIIRSAVLPGWGQVTNKKAWKVPVVYAALGISTYFFFRNLRQYKDSKSAYILATDGDPTNDYLIKQPYYSVKDQPERIRSFRKQVRQNVDYSALFFLVYKASCLICSYDIYSSVLSNTSSLTLSFFLKILTISRHAATRCLHPFPGYGQSQFVSTVFSFNLTEIL